MSQTYSYRMIDPIRDRDIALKFRRDSFDVSFGDPDGMGDPEGYLIWIEMSNLINPWSFVMMEENGKAIGQIELEIMHYGGRNIGFVDLFYLIQEYRGKRIGNEQIKYAEDFFRKYGLTEYHLRVSPTNTPALKFYNKHGFEFMMEEHLNHVVWRLRKLIK